MSPKQWLALLCFYISYLFFGAAVFYYEEHPYETHKRALAIQERMEVNELLVKYISPENKIIQNEVLEHVSSYCGKPVTNYTMETIEEPYVWNFYHCFLFTFIICSTIGYGNTVPHNTFGRMFCIFYALIGIPVNGFLFAYLGDFFGNTFTGIYKRYKNYKQATAKNYVPQRLGLIGRIILWLIPGLVFCIFLPGFIFSYFENWPYTVSIYYAFISLTTIGFGDFVASFQPQQEEEFGFYFILYELFIIIWLIVGLGYLVMILGFIAKGMRSKRLIRLEHQLSENIKATQNRIWNGVTKDVGYLRRILNEVYMMKFKPIYHDVDEKTTINALPRSASCPDLMMYRSETPRITRKRAYSEHYAKPLDSGTISSFSINRVQSDTDLSRINKKKTFEGANMFNNGDILAKVVTALGSIRPNDEDGQSVLNIGMEGGFHGFTDSQILASERSWSAWSLAPSDGSFAVPPLKQRARAASEFRPPMRDQLDNENDWTWSGNNSQIQEFMRTKAKRKQNDLYRAAFSSNNKIDNNRSVVLSIPATPEPVTQAINQSLLSRLNPFKKRTDDGKRNSLVTPDYEPQNYLEGTDEGRNSRISLPRQYLTSTARGRPSVFSIVSQADNRLDILEKTTIADLIRALEVVHTKVNASAETPLLDDYFDKPKRKLGTASLTPPIVPPLYNLFAPIAYENQSRRSSLRPTRGYTTVFTSNTTNIPKKQSTVLLNDTVARPQPTSYISRNSPVQRARRFSVRPTNLSIPPGQAPPTTITPSIQASSTLQRRLSIRPSPLARGATTQTSGRFARQSVQQQTAIAHRTQLQNQRNPLWRPAQLQAQITRTRHGSLSELHEFDRTARKRTESK